MARKSIASRFVLFASNSGSKLAQMAFHDDANPSLSARRDYVTTNTEKYGSPHTLYVHKCDEVKAALQWGNKRQQAKAFVKCVCPDDLSLKEVMGGRYDDAVRALKGKKEFMLGDLVFADAVPHDKSTSKSTEVTAVISAGVFAGGIKRKRK